MSDSDQSAFGKFVPGFEFMQNLARQATGGLAQGVQQALPQMPSLGSWVAPTFNVEDLEKRIDELKSVHFWLEQNARALGATIQALEVQKMTLSTLQGMNLSMGDVANALKVKASEKLFGMAGLAGGGGKAAVPASDPTPTAPTIPVFFEGISVPVSPMVPVAAAPTKPTSAATSAPAVAAATKKESGMVDPMQWWGALTQQFQAIATQAMQDATGQATLEAGKQVASNLTREAVMDAGKQAASNLTREAVKTATGLVNKAAALAGKPLRAASALQAEVSAPSKVPGKSPAKPVARKPAKATASPQTQARNAVAHMVAPVAVAAGKAAVKSVAKSVSDAASKNVNKRTAPAKATSKAAPKAGVTRKPPAGRGR